MTFRTTLLASTALVLSVACAGAADLPSTKLAPVAPTFTTLPAVDGVNGKIELSGGWADQTRFNLFSRNNFTGSAKAALSIPLGQSFGFQADGLLASQNGGTIAGGGGHLFWRDPSRALVGVYGSISNNTRFGGRTYYRLAGEGALYLDRFTVAGIAGYEWADKGTPFAAGAGAVFNFGDKGRFFDMVDLSYYATDNWKFSVGHRYVGGRHAAAVGTEAVLVSNGGMALSGFIDARIGERDYKAVLAGIKIYFGQKDKTLIRRHREDDPPVWLEDDKFTAGNRANKGPAGLVCPPGQVLFNPAPGCGAPFCRNNVT